MNDAQEPKQVTYFKGNSCSLETKLFGPVEMKELPMLGQMKAISMFEIYLPPKKTDHKLLFHKDRDELVYILEGKAEGIVDGKTVDLEKGDYLHLPAGVPHDFRTSDSHVRALAIFCPPLDFDKPDVHMIKEE